MQKSLFSQQEKAHLDRELQHLKDRYGDNPNFVIFQITLFDGTPVNIRFHPKYICNMAHFDLYGTMTETGYRSHFSSRDVEWTDEKIQKMAIQVGDDCRRKLLQKNNRTRRATKSGGTK